MKFPYTFLIYLLFSTVFSSFSQEEKSIITVNYPTEGTVWTIPELVKLEWNVKNIDNTKSTRFFLVRDEMVVQELGSYENTGLANGISLAKNIGSGNRYQVVGIELFPNDKYNIAKFVTPFFSIVNPASDERKKQKALTSQVLVTPKKKREKKKKQKQKEEQKQQQKQQQEKKKQEKKQQEKKKEQEKEEQEKKKPESIQQPSSKPKPVVTTVKEKEVKPTIREEFDGRKISYTKELTFSNENISIKIWDHGREDGDIVSIFLNGTSIVSKHNLTYSKKEFKVTLDQNKSNDLFLYAHNLGTAPPNTVSIEITDGTTSENIILNSDLKSCEAVMISVKK